jgi:uric acid transporter
LATLHPLQREDSFLAGERSVEQRLPAWRLLILGFQHVLVMYAGDVAVPLIIGAALHLPESQIAFLVNAGLLTSGVATLLQSVGIWRFGVRLPVMMGSTFLAVAPMIAMAQQPDLGLGGFYGALIVAGVIGICIAPLIGKAIAFFPPVVCGSLIMLLGVSLMPVAIGWIAGGSEFQTQRINNVPVQMVNPSYGRLSSLLIALVVVALILGVMRFAKGITKNLAVILGIVIGTVLAVPFGLVHFRGLATASWIAIVYPFHLARPSFHAGAILTMSIVMLITFVESTAVFLALAEISEIQLENERVCRGLRADGLGMVIGGVFNAFPFTSYSQNVGLVAVTGVRSRNVCGVGGAILIALGLLPKLGYIVAAIPPPVLGGAGLVMFGMVASSGARTLGAIDFRRSPYDLTIIAVALGVGMIPTLSPNFFQHLPSWSSPITHSGVVMGTMVAVLLNIFFGGHRRLPAVATVTKIE